MRMQCPCSAYAFGQPEAGVHAVHTQGTCTCTCTWCTCTCHAVHMDMDMDMDMRCTCTWCAGCTCLQQEEEAHEWQPCAHRIEDIVHHEHLRWEGLQALS
jgi:hypothetical protein